MPMQASSHCEVTPTSTHPPVNRQMLGWPSADADGPSECLHPTGWIRIRSESDQVEDLATRAGPSGICAFGFITRGSYASTVEGGFFAQGPIQAFFKETFNISIWDFVSMAEGFACNQAKCDITKGKVQTVNYVHYGSQIVEKHKVHITGWPTRIPFQNPYSLSMPQARELYDLWKSNGRQWKVMTPTEHRAFVKELNERHTAGDDVDIHREE
ncbi:hypothetical protein V5O48_019255 [Marasmius crinis-equi]|uniref:Uncharacterized protein n=1 Tax=Marasmius crinis-equi TaxID=585013 RepID=A0ABR3EIZ7_9AGAR